MTGLESSHGMDRKVINNNHKVLLNGNQAIYDMINIISLVFRYLLYLVSEILSETQYTEIDNFLYSSL